MSKTQPLLSICIPTYNRSQYLKKAVESIICQPEFINTDEVEIIICDNCSEDDTKDVGLQLQALHPSKILYHRNEINIHGANFEKALSLGNGVYLKLNNDTLINKKNSLKIILELAIKTKNTTNLLFFANGNAATKNEIVECRDFDEFVKEASYWTTWIGAFCLSKKDFENFENFNQNLHLFLSQTDVLFRLINSKKKKVFISNTTIFESVEPKKKGGYDILDVFLENYIGLLTKEMQNGNLSAATLKLEKRKLLFKFLLPLLRGIKIDGADSNFSAKNPVTRIFKYYKNAPSDFIRFYGAYTKIRFISTYKRVHAPVIK